MTAAYPQHVKAAHINLIPAVEPSFKSNPLLALQNLVTPQSTADKNGR
jgi:hypothetical protein